MHSSYAAPRRLQPSAGNPVAEGVGFPQDIQSSSSSSNSSSSNSSSSNSWAWAQRGGITQLGICQTHGRKQLRIHLNLLLLLVLLFGQTLNRQGSAEN